jgi:hypothetical protein
MKRIVPVVIALAALSLRAQAQYPRIGNLWGVSPASVEYEKWSRYGLIVSSGGSLGTWRNFSAQLRKRNPRIVLLETAAFMNLGKPEATPFMRDEWYLRKPDGGKVIWWADQVYTPNLLVGPCLDALVKQSLAQADALVREKLIDGLFYDSVVGAATWLGDVDTNRDGKADRAADVDLRWCDAQCAFFDRVKGGLGGAAIVANDADTRHQTHINGRLFEGIRLLDQVDGGGMSIQEAVSILTGWMDGATRPGLTFAIATHPIGWQAHRVGVGNMVTSRGELDRARRDYRRMRFGLGVTLLTDAYYAYDLGTVWYGLPWWYAEYDAPLGRPLGPAREVALQTPALVASWSAGRSVDAMQLDQDITADARGIEGVVRDQNAGWRRLFGTRPSRIRFVPGRTYRVQAQCELTAATGLVQFQLRTPTGGWEQHDKGIRTFSGKKGDRWIIDVTVKPDAFDDYGAEWHMNGAGGLLLRSLTVTEPTQSYWERRFSGGAVLVNGGDRPLRVPLAQPMRRLKSAEAPLHALEADDGDAAFTCSSGWQSRQREDRIVGATYRVARKPGATAAWRFTAPAAGRYTLYACLPGGKGWTNAAIYRCGSSRAVIDQRGGDGGWVRVLQAEMKASETRELQLTSSGMGDTAADAIRVESVARFHDGSNAGAVALQPRDAVVLLAR